MAILDANEPILTDEAQKRHRAMKKAAQGMKGASTAKMSSDPADGLKGALENDAEVTAKQVKEKSEVKGGLVEHVKQDFAYTKEFLGDASGILSGKKAEAAAELGVSAAVDGAGKVDELKKSGSTYLENMGRGNKTLGGAKVAAYMVGASMLTDMLNPFDAD